MKRVEVMFADLPSEIVFNILSRLPVRSIGSCKCVCKSWLQLLSSPQFSKSHLLNSKPGLIVYLYQWNSQLFKIFEYEDPSDGLESHELHYNPVTEFDRRTFISHNYADVRIQGSANGFLFLRDISTRHDVLYICNPVTRDYIELPSPEWNVDHDLFTGAAYGFGVSKMSDQHKVVRIVQDCIRDREDGHVLSISKSICQVYTLGTRSWRSINAPSAEYSCRSIALFLHGNLHWIVRDLNSGWWISCFDLETQLFSTFSPPSELQTNDPFLVVLVALGDCLCLCDNSSESEIVIWLMKEYGVEKSWTKEFVISKIPDFTGDGYDVVYPIKVFKDGDILMAWGHSYLFYYSSKSRALSSKIGMLEPWSPGCIEGISYTPSFVSLKCFTMEDANSF